MDRSTVRLCPIDSYSQGVSIVFKNIGVMPLHVRVHDLPGLTDSCSLKIHLWFLVRLIVLWWHDQKNFKLKPLWILSASRFVSAMRPFRGCVRSWAVRRARAAPPSTGWVHFRACLNAPRHFLSLKFFPRLPCCCWSKIDPPSGQSGLSAAMHSSDVCTFRTRVQLCVHKN